MKDSGIEWIGEIPKSWGIKKTKFLADVFSKGGGITQEDIVFDGDLPCVRYGEIYTKYDTHFESCITRTNLSNVPSPQYFSYGDILFVCTGKLVEKLEKMSCIWGNEQCLAGGDMIVTEHSNDVNRPRNREAPFPVCTQALFFPRPFQTHFQCTL